MNRSILAGVATALFLTGCACHHPLSSMPDPLNPRVFVVAGKDIAVDQELIYIPMSVGSTTIRWHLPTDSPYTFPANGIVVDKAGDEFTCSLGAGGKETGGKTYECKFKNSKFGKYKYTIRVNSGSKPLDPLDPFIANG
jgi:hypothetical protein